MRALVVVCLGLCATSALATVIYKDLEVESIVIDDSPEQPNLTELELASESSQEEPDKCETSHGIRGTCLTLEECYSYFRYVDNVDLIKTGLMEFVENATSLCEGPQGNVCCGDRVIPFVRIRSVNANKLSGDPNSTVETSPQTDDGNSLPTNCGNAPMNFDKFVVGRPALPQEFPYAAALLKNNVQYCSGSLISSRWVLTAAHCVNDVRDLEALSVNIGEQDLSSPLDHVSRGIDKIVYHADFTMRLLRHDIALLRLKEPVQFSDAIQPICLNKKEPPFNQKGRLIGWGRTGAGKPSSTTLHTVQMSIFHSIKCKERYESAGLNLVPPLQDEMLCVGNPTAGSPDFIESCMADSGSPFSFSANDKAFQIGLVSWGIGCGKKPGVYTRVDKYISWIEKNISL